MYFHELNNSREMLGRVLYILYMGLFALTTIMLVRSTAPEGIAFLLVGMVLILSGIGLRELGYRYFEFSRLRESFPHGNAADWIPERIRNEAATLLADFQECSYDGTRRQEIRQRLMELTDRQPLLLIVFERELEKVIPGIHQTKAKPEIAPWGPIKPPSKKAS